MAYIKAFVIDYLIILAIGIVVTGLVVWGVARYSGWFYSKTKASE